MADINIDLSDKALTVKTRRIFTELKVKGLTEQIYVVYREIKYTGTIGKATYNEINSISKSYRADWDKWFTSDAGLAIKAGIEIELATEEPGSNFVEPVEK